VFVEYLAAYIYGRLDTPEAALDRFMNLKFDDDNPSAQIARAPFLAEIPGRRDELSTVFDGLMNEYQHSPQVLFRSLSIPALAGDPDGLKKGAQRLLTSNRPEFRLWHMEAAILLLADKIDEQTLMEKVGSSRRGQCVAHHAIGLRSLASGHREAAREQFEKCVDTGVYGYFDYAWAKAFLARMQDPRWPEWIERHPSEE
jgi:hypothetical protein